MNRMALPEVGTLVNPFGDVIPGTLASSWSQPGGAGTLVFPQAVDSAPGEFEPPLIPIGQYSFGCGHYFNLPWIFQAYDPVTQEEYAVIACPVCSYCQVIILLSEFLDYVQFPIVVA